MPTKANITPFQFYTLLFLSRIFSLVAYIANMRAQLSSSETLVGSLLMGIFLLLTSLPTLWLMKKDANSSVLTRASCLSAVYEKIICLIYLADFFFYGIMTATRFELFASSVMFPETDMSFVVLTLLAASAYAGYKGIEALGRSAVIFLLPVLLVFVFVFCSLLGDFDFLNFTPFTTKNLAETVDSGLYTCAQTHELIAVGILLPFVKEQKRKSLPVWILLITGIIFLTNLMLAGILGSFSTTQLFGMYSLSVLAEFGFVERMDSIITCVWMICALVKLAYIFFLCDYLLSSLFGKEKKVLYLLLSVAVIFAGMLALSRSIFNFSQIVTSPVSMILYLVSAVGVPLSVVLAEKIKGRKQDEKA